ncbi:nicotinate-nucleotide--dimethylbenzimidazole phosphoribosyltransferase [Acinetobacter larvae]|uniref:Nicotinate-nucleotide--dimethylbenzimidazole phosphoribosyltransferase n=1 Tax=Acinetobacter larvae TaxID=1789224 RepID=A0A1B2M0E9_9GAMM|nr:nicotinate-nucleotide--dimethylbenzimidazole phosphoribosyltransferase [Acinetobacter larvae]AOA58684.1 nicotinate-nucleotide--dimethylbenzimidazole phosphoribosyltransferase [Acinetobacter larvae]
MKWWQQACQKPNNLTRQQAIQHQLQLTKPAGALGELENIAIQLAALQATVQPHVDQIWICIYAADHGVVAENISAYPQQVTRQMLSNFAHGGACIAVMARQYQAHLEVIDCGIVGAAVDITGVKRCAVASGTANFTQQAAMNIAQCEQALSIGYDSVERAIQAGSDLYVAGEMGIGNTCAATALAGLLLKHPAAVLTGPGTGLNADTLQHKIAVIERAIALHAPRVGQDALQILAAVGGFEIAAMVGAYIRCAQRGLAVVVDGFISTVAALIAVHLNSAVRPWLIFAHQSAEPGHALVLEALNAHVLLKLNLRLGEASGAGAALGLIRLACLLHQQMATFSRAEVDQSLQ